MKSMKTAMLALMTSFGLGSAACASTVVAPYEAYVTVDINPSVAFVLNERNQVQTVHANNEDGEMVLLHLTLEQKTMDQALELYLDEVMNLGFIDVDAEDTLIEVDVIGSRQAIEQTVQTNVQARLQQVMKERHLEARVQAKEYTVERQQKAQQEGVTPIQLRLMEAAMIADPTRSMNEYKIMSNEALMQQVRNQQQQLQSFAHQFQTTFFDARQTLITTFQTEVADLQHVLEVAVVAEEDTTALEAQLVAREAQFTTELQALIAEMRTASVDARTGLELQHQLRLRLHQGAANAKRGTK